VADVLSGGVLRRYFRIALTSLALVAAAADAQSVFPVMPEAPGPYAVACSNIEQDFSRVPSGASAKDFWEGSGGHYVTDLLVDPADSFVVQQAIPNNSELFGSLSGKTVAYANLVCYPTDSGNLRSDYTLPTGNVVPHMQRGAEPPIFPASGGKFPVMLFSHGLTGSPISGDYIETLKVFASYGYVVVAPFHGDERFADINLDNLSDLVYALIHIKSFVAMQAVRPLSLSLALDTVLANAGFRDHVDPDRIVGFGASLGGESLLLMGGAALTTTIGLSSTRVTLDTRLKAAATYVPFFGNDIYPAFGRDSKGLDDVTLPILAMSGTADTTAPITTTLHGMERLGGTRQLVAFTGLHHGYDPGFRDEINTWTIRFLAGQILQSEKARALSARMTTVLGGGEDVEIIDYMAPSPIKVADSGAPIEAIAVEYYDDMLKHFFITADPAEQAMLDAGIIVPGWDRTGFAFKVRPAYSTIGLSACRFFGTPGVGPNSHFFTIDPAECAQVKANPLWTYEGIAFVADPPSGSVCGADRTPVLRLYNNGMQGQANHRFTTSRSEARANQAAGWMIEGVGMCAIP
jgi:hypothetical protein